MKSSHQVATASTSGTLSARTTPAIMGAEVSSTPIAHITTRATSGASSSSQ
jgi:2-succinyl-5-enolpyruvyl-6-hydroxy-3-cyclohexene-1-carboxylate synthase